MKFKVTWTEIAEDDLASIVEYIAEDNVNSAIKIFEDIKNITTKLDLFPQRGRVVPELQTSNIFIYRELIYKHWRIAYKIEDVFVKIIAVFDAHRNLEDLLLDRILRKDI